MKTQLNSILKSFTAFASALAMFTVFGGSTASAQTAPNDIVADWGEGSYTIAGSRAALLAERSQNGQYEQVMTLVLPDGSTTVQRVRTELIAGEGSNWQVTIRLLGNPPAARQTGGSNLLDRIRSQFQSNAHTDDGLAYTFANISMIIVQNVTDPAVFGGRKEVIRNDWTFHHDWAKAQSRDVMLHDLLWKTQAAYDSLNDNAKRSFESAVAGALNLTP